jgi:hypothetical protein
LEDNLILSSFFDSFEDSFDSFDSSEDESPLFGWHTAILQGGIYGHSVVLLTVLQVVPVRHNVNCEKNDTFIFIFKNKFNILVLE